QAATVAETHRRPVEDDRPVVAFQPEDVAFSRGAHHPVASSSTGADVKLAGTTVPTSALPGAQPPRASGPTNSASNVPSGWVRGAGVLVSCWSEPFIVMAKAWLPPWFVPNGSQSE